MTVFANAGIYLFVDLDTFPTYIVEGTPSWTTAQESAYEKVMDEFQKYTNTAVCKSRYRCVFKNYTDISFRVSSLLMRL